MKTLSLLIAACCAAAPALALDLTSSTASSASSAGSASVGSVSDSLRSSSQSSAGPRQMADGPYRVIEMAEVAGRPGDVRLTLRAEAPAPSPQAQAEARTAVQALAQMQAQLPAQTQTTPRAIGADAGAGPQWELRLPRAVAEREGLAPGRLVRAAQQPYGVSFALAEQPRPFFLVLADDWQRELPAHPVRAASGA